jgi:hypothetical protein
MYTTYRLLELEGGLYSLKGGAPLHDGGLADVLEDDTSATCHLVVHQLRPVLSLLLAVLLMGKYLALTLIAHQLHPVLPLLLAVLLNENI